MLAHYQVFLRHHVENEIETTQKDSCCICGIFDIITTALQVFFMSEAE